MKKLRLKFKRFLLRSLTKEIIAFEDSGKSTELHCYKLFGTYVKITQFIKPIEPNDEQCEYLGIINQGKRRLYNRFLQLWNLKRSSRAIAQRF